MTAIEGHLHPVTPLRRGWGYLAAVATLAYQFRDLVLADPGPDKITIPVWVAVTAGVVIVVAVFVLCVISWKISHYRLDGNVLEYRYGILFKVRRRFELRHVQSVDIERPLFGRLLGVCTLSVSLAGPRMRLSYLGLRQARKLKATILGEDTGEQLYRMSNRDLLVSLALDLRATLGSLAAVTAALAPYIISGSLFALSTLIAVLPRAWRITGKRLFTWRNWTLTRTTDGGYRTDHGLLDTQQYTYRPARVDAIELHQPLLWRSRNWVKIKVAVSGNKDPGVLIPVCPRRTAEKMIAHLLGPDAVTIVGEPIPVPHRARRVTLFHKALGYRTSTKFLAVWDGIFLHNIITIVPIARIQETGVEQGPWARRNRLASTWVEMSGYDKAIIAHHIDTLDAQLLATALHQQAKHSVHTQEQEGKTT